MLQKILQFKLHYYWLPILLSAFLLLFSLLGYLGRYVWFCDLFSHFKVQYFLTAIACGVILIFCALFAMKKQTHNQKNSETEKSNKFTFPLDKKALLLFAAFSFAVALINLLEITPLMFYHPTPEFKFNNSTKIRLMQVNVNTANTRYQDVEKYILGQDPDILLLEEVNSKWLFNLNQIQEKYPYKILYPQDDNFGIAMFAKIKPSYSKINHFGDYALPFIQAKFKICKDSITIFGIHTIPPIGKTRWQERNSMLQDMGNWVKQQQGHPTILLGDLNITPYSFFFKKLQQDGNLRNSQCGFGIQPSWPNQLFPLLIPIDHCLVTKDIEVSNRFIGPNVGSDHFPLVIDIKVP